MLFLILTDSGKLVIDLVLDRQKKEAQQETYLMDTGDWNQKLLAQYAIDLRLLSFSLFLTFEFTHC